MIPWISNLKNKQFEGVSLSSPVCLIDDSNAFYN